MSICWRLIPYFLNNWEQSWGAECSSMTFELPHFAVELLVILPCVQVQAVVPVHPNLQLCDQRLRAFSIPGDFDSTFCSCYAGRSWHQSTFLYASVAIAPLNPVAAAVAREGLSFRRA